MTCVRPLFVQDAQELFQMVIRLVSEEAEARPAAAGNGIGTHLKGLKLLAEVNSDLRSCVHAL